MTREDLALSKIRPDLSITIEVGGERFSIGAVRLPDGKLHIKRGRAWSAKMPVATTSQVFAAARQWAVRRLRCGR